MSQGNVSIILSQGHTLKYYIKQSVNHRLGNKMRGSFNIRRGKEGKNIILNSNHQNLLQRGEQKIQVPVPVIDGSNWSNGVQKG
jgi:hypothetical protein